MTNDVIVHIKSMTNTVIVQIRSMTNDVIVYIRSMANDVIVYIRSMANNVIIHIRSMTNDVIVHIISMTNDVIVHIISMTNDVIVHIISMTNDVIVHIISMTNDVIVYIRSVIVHVISITNDVIVYIRSMINDAIVYIRGMANDAIVHEFVPLDDLKGQRPRYKSETCMEISVTENPRKRSKSESHIERDSPLLFVTGKNSGKCNSEQKFDEDFQTAIFDLNSDNSDGSITPVFSLESFIERCNSSNLVSESYIDRSNTPVCVQENSVVDRSDTPTFVPSVDKTEKIICSTLSKCKQLRRSKTDPGFDNSLRYPFWKHQHHDPLDMDDIDFYFNLEEIPLRSSVSSSPGEFFHNYKTDSKDILIQPKRKLSSTGVQTSFDENCNEIPEKEDKLDLKKLLLKVSTGTNTTDSLERPKKKVKENRKMSAKENKQGKTGENQTSDVNSVHSSEKCDTYKENKKPTQNTSHETQSPVKKPTSFPSELVTNMSSFLNDESPEMQVIVNATSPVLFRRRSSNNFRTNGKFQVQNVDGNPPETSVSQDTNNDLFMNPDMAKTWHGITSNKWKTYYGPIMRSMLQEINNNNNNNNETGSENSDINQSLQYNSNSLRARTLLDEMHKKYCAYQYKNRLQLPSPDDLILPFKLKSSPPPPNRMLSRSWIFRKYAVPTNTPSPSPSPESPEISESSAANQLEENKDGQREATPADSSGKQAQPKQILVET
ncbi:hypothetical protein KUTeg_024924 [Tegillarca granosa]|uniref:Uncharacterized protein n=1 Tax=Tegillarca granosa TaxID=220873 RepID=A0ABQ9E510_TEGGR|nr:hypothetical protein KUTeg_024924 [Tegillarca granosa]